MRTKIEMSKVPAHFELIPEIIALKDEVAPQTLLTINGDIANREHGLKLAQKYPGVDGVMIGRGVFHDPFCFTEPLGSCEEAARQASLINLLRYHLDLFDKYQTEIGRPYETLKRFFKIYIRDFDGAKELRDQLMHTTSTNQVRQLLTDWQL